MGRAGKIILELFFISLSLILIAAVAVLLWNFMNVWLEQYNTLINVKLKLYFIALGVTVVTILAQWVEGRAKSIKQNLNNISKYVKWRWNK